MIRVKLLQPQQKGIFRISQFSSLFKLKRHNTYSVLLGYCQGQSFLIAALLLQMPEEQSFGVLVQIMHRYGLRDMFRSLTNNPNKWLNLQLL